MVHYPGEIDQMIAAELAAVGHQHELEARIAPQHPGNEGNRRDRFKVARGNVNDEPASTASCDLVEGLADSAQIPLQDQRFMAGMQDLEDPWQEEHQVGTHQCGYLDVCGGVTVLRKLVIRHQGSPHRRLLYLHRWYPLSSRRHQSLLSNRAGKRPDC